MLENKMPIAKAHFKKSEQRPMQHVKRGKNPCNFYELIVNEQPPSSAQHQNQK